jgi:hypothetical protein
MSYHDGYIKPGSTGISVVNPLHEAQLKLDKITQLVNELSTAEHEDAGVISIEHLRMILTLQNILDGTDDEKDVK